MPSAISDSGIAAWPINSSVRSAIAGNGMPSQPHAVPIRMLATTGLVATFFTVTANPASETWRVRAHSMDTVTRIHSNSELNTRTSDTTGSAASPSRIVASGRPSSRLFAKMPPTPKTDCSTPSILNTRDAMTRPTRNTSEAAAEVRDAASRASTGGRREKSLISRNSTAGMATAKTNRVSASETLFGQPNQRTSA